MRRLLRNGPKTLQRVVLALGPICTPVSCAFDPNITMGPATAHLVINVTGYVLPTPKAGRYGHPLIDPNQKVYPLDSATTFSGRIKNITSGSVLTRNFLINLLGLVAPLPVAIVTFPRIIEGLGTDRFGILSLAWVVIGYFSLFDFGLSRALTKFVAEKIGSDRDQDIPSLVWTASILILILGILSAAIIGLLTPAIVYRTLNIPAGLRVEMVDALYWLALAIPSVIVTSSLTGVLAAMQRFDVINCVRIPLALFAYVSPLLVLPFTQDLSAVVAVLVLGRNLACLVYGAYTMRLLSALGQGIVFDRALVKPLLLFGGWMTVSNLVGPMMVYLDRFLIGIMVSVASVAYYTIPYDMVTKILIIPLALVGVLFPAFTTTFAEDREQTSRIYDRGIRYSFLTLFPIILVVVAFARESLTIWLGEPFALHSTLVLQLLAIGVLLNSLAQPPFALIQALGRPDLTAKLHLLELPVYLLALWWALQHYGINGAALVWTLRVAIDLLALYGIAQRLLPAASAIHRRAVYSVSVSLATVGFYLFALSPHVKVLSVALLLVLFSFIVWFSVLGHDERTLLSRWSKRAS
jgi:O-antigen/teichoic acid export membrane protein